MSALRVPAGMAVQGPLRVYGLVVWWYTLGVILFGAVVRITGSGAGCGQHWPTCHGEVVPLAHTVEQVIEFSHRLTSGVCMLLVWALTALVLRTTARGHAARRPAALATVFIITEALIGAGIVLLQYVADNASYWRAVWMAGHLVNTFLLMAWLGLTVWHLRWPQAVRFDRDRVWVWRTGVGLALGMVLVSATGAVSALGHTLFPALPEQSVLEHITDDPWRDTPYPMLLRLVHPATSMLVAALALAWGNAIWGRFGARVDRWAIALMVAVGLQVVAGFINVGLSAPGWMQLVHLALANGVWILLVFTGAAAGQAGDAAPGRGDEA
jgi:heme A synthase